MKDTSKVTIGYSRRLCTVSLFSISQRFPMVIWTKGQVSALVS